MYLSQPFKGTLKNNLKQFTSSIHVLLAICEQIVSSCENYTFHVSLGCLNKPVDDLFKLLNAAGMWIYVFG